MNATPRVFSPRSALVVLCATFLAGCAGKYAIKYELGPNTLSPSERTLPLVVRVATFTDSRPEEEKVRSAREAKGGGDVGDYTYDEQFEGQVAGEISKMVAAHLAYVKVFRAVELAPLTPAAAAAPRTLDSLNTAGVDALLVGEVSHFYGFFDQNMPRAFLFMTGLGVASGLLLNFNVESDGGTLNVSWYGPGMALGAWLDSRHARRVERATQLKVRLLSTTTHAALWEQTIDVASKTSAPASGFTGGTRKYEAAVGSLVDAVRSMAAGLGRISLPGSPQ